MAVTNQQIIDFLLANPGMSDAQIVSAMAQYGVSPAQMANATGLQESEVSARVAAVVPPGQSVNLGGTPIQSQYIIEGTGDAQQIMLRPEAQQVQQEVQQVQQNSAYTAENINKLASQILAQGTTSKWSGGLSPETSARYMADDLAKSGITDISQVGKGPDGIINKVTGEKLVSGYGERTGGNLWSGSYEGKGNTGFGVEFDAQGNPVFYTQGASSSTLGKDILKLAAVGGAIYGLGGFDGLLGGTAVGADLAGLSGVPEAGLLSGAQGVPLSELLPGASNLATATNVADVVAPEVLGMGAGTGLSTASSALPGATLGEGLLSGSALGAGALGVGALGALSSGAGAAGGSMLGNALAQGAGSAAGSLLGGAITGGLGLAGGVLQQQTSKEAAQKAAADIAKATQQGVEASQFRPVGMTTRFGTSNYTYDPVTGRMTSAGYQLSPEAKAAQDRLVALAGRGLTQAEQAQQQFAPLQTGATNLFSLGNQYISQSPQDVAQNYLNQQMALLQPSRELELANLQNRLQQQGRAGLSVAQGGTLGATTPELQALYNARAQQEAQLAANAQQAGQQNVLFGAGLLGQGASAMGNYYSGQQAAYAPYTTALGQIQGLETAAQQPLQMGVNLAQQASAAGANAGKLGVTGAIGAGSIMTSPAVTNNPYATFLGGLSSPQSLLGQGIANYVTGYDASANQNAVLNPYFTPNTSVWGI